MPGALETLLHVTTANAKEQENMIDAFDRKGELFWRARRVLLVDAETGRLTNGANVPHDVLSRMAVENSVTIEDDGGER